MRFGAMVDKYLELVNADELRDVACVLLDRGMSEDEIVAGLAKLVDAAVPADVLLSTLGPAGAVAGAVVERYDDVIAAALLRPMVRLARDPDTRKLLRRRRNRGIAGEPG